MVDTSVVDSIREALVHIIRNAVDHGIEAAEERQAAGKEPVGAIVLRATRKGGNIVIEVHDDGRGLDRAAILARARARGLVAGDAELGPAEIEQLLFLPGFTTSDAVSDLSGRGVGLDVVRRRIEALRGAVHVESAPGFGTTIRIRLPLTLAILECYHVLAGGRHYAIPADGVLECCEWEGSGGQAHDRSVAQRNGSALACLRLSWALGSTADPPAREELLVVDSEGVAAGLVVDRVVGSAPMVIKPLGSVFSGLPGLAGFTILGDGEVAPILDVAGVIDQQRVRSSEDAL